MITAVFFGEAVASIVRGETPADASRLPKIYLRTGAASASRAGMKGDFYRSAGSAAPPKKLRSSKTEKCSEFSALRQAVNCRALLSGDDANVGQVAIALGVV